MTEEEFITQGVVETKKALDQLKEYCRSPESKPWRPRVTPASDQRVTLLT